MSDLQTSSCLKQAEQAASAIIKYLDNKLWQKVALKAISQMPKYILSGQSSNILEDFAFVSTQMQLKGGYFSEEDEKMSPGRQRQLAGFADLIKKHKNQQILKVIEEVPQKLLANWKKRKSEKLQFQGKVLSTSTNLNQTKANNFLRLFISEPQNQEEIKKEDSLRINKFEMSRYNQLMEKMQKDQRMFYQQRRLTQQKKIKEAKKITYDYQGKLMSVSAMQGSNIKIFSIKSYSKTASNFIPKMKKINMQQKMYNTDKISIVNNKRVVSGQSKLSFDNEEFNYSKISQKGRLPIQNNFLDLFKGGKQVQMGVSITDMGNKSKIYGQNNSQNQKAKMNLSQFKQLKHAFKQRERNLTQMVEKLKKNEVKVDSEVESRMISSSFSHLMQRSGKIKKNDRAYTQDFRF